VTVNTPEDYMKMIEGLPGVSEVLDLLDETDQIVIDKADSNTIGVISGLIRILNMFTVPLDIKSEVSLATIQAQMLNAIYNLGRQSALQPKGTDWRKILKEGDKDGSESLHEDDCSA